MRRTASPTVTPTAATDRTRPVRSRRPPSERIWIFVDARDVVINSEHIALTRIEFDLLLFLTEHRHRVFSRTHLLRSVWGHQHTTERTVDVHIRRLRAKVGERPIVTTVRGVGYRLSSGAEIEVVRSIDLTRSLAGVPRAPGSGSHLR